MRAYLNAPARRISLGTATVRIGSASGNELILNDPLIAPVHAEIAPGEHGYQLTDLASAQGVLVNGQFLFPHVPQQLQNGDVILLGNISLTYEAIKTEASEALPFADHAEAQATDQASESTIPDQPTQTEIPALSLVTKELAPAEPGASPTEIALHGSEETATAVPPAGAPAYVQAPVYAALPPQPPVTPSGEAVYGASSASMQPAPQVYPPFGVPGYAFAQAATPSVPAQPGYPAIAYAQPGYAPLPGQFPAMAPTPTAQKHNRVFLWITLIIVVILLIAVSNTATYALTHASTPKPQHAPTLPSPNGVLKTYCQSIIAGNADAIYNLLSDQAKIHTSLDDIQKTFEELKLLNSSSGSVSAQYTYCTFDNIRVSNPLAVATVALTLTLKIQSQTMTEIALSLTSLIWEHSQWKIDFSQMAQPQPTINISGSSATPTPLP